MILRLILAYALAFLLMQGLGGKAGIGGKAGLGGGAIASPVAPSSTMPVLGSVTTASNVGPSWTISGTHPTIVVAIGYQDASITVSSVTWSLGGTGVQGKLIRGGSGVNDTTAIWCIPAPTTGTGTLTVTLSGAPAGNYTWSGDAFTGADQTTPCPTGNAVSNISASSSYTMTPSGLTSSDAAYAVGVDASDCITVTPNQTLNDCATSIATNAGYNTGTGSVTITFTQANDSKSSVAVRIVGG